MKGKKCILSQKLFIIFALLFVPLLISLKNVKPASAITTYASAYRYQFAVDLTQSNSYTWSEPVRYNEYVQFDNLAGSQVNTYPTVAPSGQYVSLSGFQNISLVSYDFRYPVSFIGLSDLTVVCGWGNETLITDASSISYHPGKWEGSLNNRQAYVQYLDINFNWSGHFSGSYQNVSANSLLSCNIRRKSHSGNYFTPFGLGHLPSISDTYVYSSDSVYNSYISVETSNDGNINAINGVSDAVNNVNSTLQEIQNKDDQDRQDLQNQQSDSESSASSAGSDVNNAGTRLLDVVTTFFGLFITPPQRDCKIRADLGHMDLGIIDLCELSPPPAFSIMASLIMIGATIPFAISVINSLLKIMEGALTT